MCKVLKYEEIKKNKQSEYSESYKVKFWIQKGEFWKQKIEMYFTKIKGANKYVINRWIADYHEQNVKYISVTYQ